MWTELPSIESDIVSKLKSVFNYSDEILSSIRKQFKCEQKKLGSFTERRTDQRNKQTKKKCFGINSVDSSLRTNKYKKLRGDSDSIDDDEERTLFNVDDNKNKKRTVSKHPAKPTKRNADDTPVTSKLAAGSCDKVLPVMHRLKPKKLMDITSQDKTRANDESIERLLKVPPGRSIIRIKSITFDDITFDDECDEQSSQRRKMRYPWWTQDKHCKVLLDQQRYLNDTVCNMLFRNKSVDVESLRRIFPSTVVNQLDI